MVRAILISLFAVFSAASLYGQVNTQLPRCLNALVNREAYKNYDVTIDQNAFIQSVDSELDFLLESNSLSRMLVDYERQILILFRESKLPKSEPTAQTDSRSTILQEYFIFRDGEFRATHGTPGGIKPNFEDVFRFFSLPRMEGVATAGVSGTQDSTRESRIQYMRAFLASVPIASSQRIGSDTTKETYSAGEFYTTQIFHDQFLMPSMLRLDTRESFSGVGEPIRVRNNTLENVDGVCRVVSAVSTERTKRMFQDQNVPVTIVENIRLTWHQFNVDELKLPDIDALLNDPEKVKAFMLEGSEKNDKSE